MLVKDLVCSYDFVNSENYLSEITVNGEELEFDINEDGELWIQSDCLKMLDKEVKSWSLNLDFDSETTNGFSDGCFRIFPRLMLDIRAD